HYNRPELVKSLAAMINDYRPTMIRHMDASITIPYTSLCWRCAGHDHPDHIASARLVRDAIDMAPGNYSQAAYVDYPTQERAANLNAAEIASKTDAFKLYALDDYRYCPEPALCKEPAGTAADWVARTYYVVHRMQPPALVSGMSGGYLLFATGELNNAANVRGSADEQWSVLGGRTAGAVVAFNLADGRAGVLTRDATGRLWTNTQSPDSRWQGWRQLNGVRGIDLPVVINDKEGRPVALVLGNDGLFHYAAQIISTDGTSIHWITLPRLARSNSQAVMALDAQGRLVVFATDRSGYIWVSSQTDGGGSVWSKWRRIKAAQSSGGLAAMRNKHGKIELYARERRSGHLLKMVQAAPGLATERWDKPLDLGVSYVGQPGIGLNERGEVAVAGLEHAGGAIWLVEGMSVTSLGGGIDSAPALRTVNGTLYVASRSNEVTQTYRLWRRSKGGWQSVDSLSAPFATGGVSFSSVLAG
ncbi:MAG TPA: PIG-L family deacetylase, partial [Eoetvoesiella sp.]